MGLADRTNLVQGSTNFRKNSMLNAPIGVVESVLSIDEGRRTEKESSLSADCQALKQCEVQTPAFGVVGEEASQRTFKMNSQLETEFSSPPPVLQSKAGHEQKKQILKCSVVRRVMTRTATPTSLDGPDSTKSYSNMLVKRSHNKLSSKSTDLHQNNQTADNSIRKMQVEEHGSLSRIALLKIVKTARKCKLKSNDRTKKAQQQLQDDEKENFNNSSTNAANARNENETPCRSDKK